MVGITYTHFKEGEPCWIVVDSPHGKEYLRGEFLREIPYEHPSSQSVRKQMHPNAKAVAARITDTRAMEKDPIEALEYGKEPYRYYYTVIPANTYTNYLVEQVEQLRDTLQRASEKITTLEKILVEVASRK